VLDGDGDGWGVYEGVVNVYILLIKFLCLEMFNMLMLGGDVNAMVLNAGELYVQEPCTAARELQTSLPSATTFKSHVCATI
jgi:hypothetical protein